MAKGVSLRKFSVACGITPTTLSALENDKYQPSRETIEKIARELEVAPVMLLLDAVTIEDIPEEKRKDYRSLEKKLKAFVEDGNRKQK